MKNELLGDRFSPGHDVVQDFAKPASPVMSVITAESCTFICTSAFCIRWIVLLMASTSVSTVANVAAQG